MYTYYAAYKCQLCGATIRYGEPKEIPYDDLPKICGMVVRNQTFINNPALYQSPMQVPHKCPDGSCGMAYFAGLKRL